MLNFYTNLMHTVKAWVHPLQKANIEKGMVSLATPNNDQKKFESGL